MTALVLFASTYVVVFALGFQQQNVTGGHYVAAFFTSFAIAGAQLFLYKLAPDAHGPEILAYFLGGSFGIVSSMWLHRRVIRRRG